MTGRVGAGDGRVRADVAAGEFRVAAGEPVTVDVEVTNVTEVIRAYRVDVLGLDPRWASAESVDLELFPGERRSTTLSFDLPEQYPAGRRRIGIEITEPGESDGSVVVVDIDLLVEPRDGLAFGVEPASMTVGPEGTFVVTPVNSGNTTLDLDLSASDPERKVQVTFDPPRPRLLPGERGVVRATARGPRPWFGMPLVRVVEFRVKGGVAEAFTAAAFIQTPRLSRRAVTLAGLVVVATLFAFVIFLSFSSVADLSAQQEALLKQSLGEDQPVGVRIEPSSIEGRVVSTTGGGIDGVSVQLYTTANPVVPAKSTVTDVQGTYRFGSLPPDTYFVRYEVAGFGESWFRKGTSIADATPIELVAGQEFVDVDAALGGQPGSIAGRIVGEEVEGALVVAQVPGSSFEGSDLAPVASRLASAEVDATGEYLLEGLPTPAGYEIVVSKVGFAPQVRTIALEPGEDRTDLEILLRRGGGVVAGTVVDSSGVAIPGATVVVSDGQTEVSTRTLSEVGSLGFFDVRELPTPGTYSLNVSAPGFFPISQTILLAQDQQLLDRRVALTASAGSVTGRVLSSSGVPLGGVDVTVLGPGLSLTTQTLSVPIAWDPAVDGAPAKRVNEDGDRIIDDNGYPLTAGTFRVDGLPLPGAYTVSYTAPGVVTQAVSVELTPGAGASRTLSTVSLDPRTGTIQGRVVTSEATLCQARSPAETAPCPISSIDGVEVTLRSSTLTRTVRPSDLPAARRGAFRFDAVPPGAYTLTVTRPGSPTQTLLVNTTSRAGFSFDFATDSLLGTGSAYGPIVVQPQAVITGRIVPFDGFTGARDYTVDVFTPETIGVPLIDPVRTGLDGAFTIRGLDAPGRYILRFQDRTTGQTFLVPNDEHRADLTDETFVELEPGSPTDMNREMRGQDGVDDGFFFPFDEFEAVPFGDVAVDVVANRPACTGIGAAVTGKVFLETDTGLGQLSYCNGVAWMKAGEFAATVPAAGSTIAPNDPDYPAVVNVVGPSAAHGPATRLVIITGPVAELNADVVVELQDAQGRRVTTGTGSSRSITVSLDPARGLLLGEAAVRASAGRATFDLEVLLNGTYTLRFGAEGLTTVRSSSFSVASGQ